MRVDFVTHESHEAPGAYETWARARGYTTTRSRVHEGDPPPSTVDDSDPLIVVGGPRSPSTTGEECPRFDAAAERALIKMGVEANKAVIGVCLGSRSLGETLGRRLNTVRKRRSASSRSR